MKHQITIHNFGPILDCQCEIDNFTILTGPQSNGKSTVAKSIYFFRTMKQDFINLMQQGGPRIVSGNNNATWSYTIQQRLRNKFLELFGTSWIMPEDMSLEYKYSKKTFVKVYLDGSYDPDRNFIRFGFSRDIEDYIADLDNRNFLNMTAGQLAAEEKNLSRLFDDDYETVFIPAGRNLITLLSTQLNYIFTSLEGSQLRNIDYITKRYTELILRLKPLFSDGINGLMAQTANQPEQQKKMVSKAAIKQLIEKANEILKGAYRYVDGEERLYLDSKKYIKINFASSGQQEIIWVINLLFYYLYEGKKVFLIIEEPESHLFPDSQQGIGELLALFAGEGNQVLVTTHSPYLLGTYNYLLLASQVGNHMAEAAKEIVHKRFWLPASKVAAYYIHDGMMQKALDLEDNIVMILNELIDGASTQINNKSEKLITLLYQQEDVDGHQ